MIQKGQLYIISAPSGAGKTSLVKALISKIHNILPAVSHTTRKCREGEVHARDYYFVEDGVFQEMIECGAFLEYATVFENYYGTSKKEVDKKRSEGIDVILEIDWQGARQIQQMVPDAKSIFILPPSLQALHDRLKNRDLDDENVIQKRMTSAQHEMVHYDEYQYLIINDVFEDALNQLCAIVISNKLTLKNQQYDHQTLINELLGNTQK